MGSYNSPVFKTYFALEGARFNFEAWLSEARDFDDEEVEERFYEHEVQQYLERVRSILDYPD